MTARTTAPAGSKVPGVTPVFWILSIAATTLGETGGETLATALGWGHLASALLSLGVLLVMLAAQSSARAFYPLLYWATFIAAALFGATVADLAEHGLDPGHAGGAGALLLLLMGVFGLWYRAQGIITASAVTTPATEGFYWAALILSQMLGIALGAWLAGTMRLGPEGGALVFAVALLVLARLYFGTGIPRVPLFWAAFILSRPLGTAAAALLERPLNHGDLGLSLPLASAGLCVFILACLLALPQRPGHPGSAAVARDRLRRNTGG